MREIDKKLKLSRRDMLKAGGGALIGATVISGGVITGSAWAAKPKALTPESFATLVQMSRDTYPHDRFNDAIYAKAVSGLDEGAAGNPDDLKLLEDGVAALNAAAQSSQNVDYGAVGWERDRVAILKSMETSPFFQKVRGHLVVGVYNNPDVWALLGYEGESASKGGYIDRGFDDINWL